jgi:hypothetical protein
MEHRGDFRLQIGDCGLEIDEVLDSLSVSPET